MPIYNKSDFGKEKEIEVEIKYIIKRKRIE